MSLPGTGPGRAQVLAEVRAALVSAHGVEPQEASVTFLGTEAMRVLRFVGVPPSLAHEEPAGGAPLVHYVTLGCSGEPMGDPAAPVLDPAGPRAELRMTLRGGVDGVVRALAVLGSTPAVDGLVLAEGAIVDLGEPLWPGAAFTAVVLRPPELPEVGLDAPAAPVRVLEAVPVTHTEAAWARVRGVDALVEAWAEAGTDVTDPARPAALPH